MFQVTIKSVNRILKPDAYSLSWGCKVGEYLERIEPFEIFFNKPVRITVQMHHSWSQGQSRTSAMAWSMQGKLTVWNRGRTIEQAIQDTCHELGHIHHYRTNWQDWQDTTNYGKERYAETFAEMCLGADYRIDWQTDYSAYEGFKERATHKRSVYEKQMRERIKPLDLNTK